MTGSVESLSCSVTWLKMERYVHRLCGSTSVLAIAITGDMLSVLV